MVTHAAALQHDVAARPSNDVARRDVCLFSRKFRRGHRSRIAIRGPNNAEQRMLCQIDLAIVFKTRHFCELKNS